MRLFSLDIVSIALISLGLVTNAQSFPEPSMLFLSILSIAVYWLSQLRNRKFFPRGVPAFTCCAVAVFISWVSPLAYGQAQSFQLQEATVQDINDAFDAGLLTSERLVQLYLNRIEAYDQQGPALNSILTLNPNALETARALDVERQANGPRSVLHGIPILLKDQLDTFDMPTTSGSFALRDSIPPDDAFIVQKLRNAGAIILGKTNLDEFASGSITLSSLGGQTRSPYDITRVPGGSSGGTATAIAANFAVIGTGSDSWGSIQHPASLNGLVGFMPTRSLVSGDGTIPKASERRGVTGPLARTVADAAAMLDIIAGYDPADPVTAAGQGHVPGSYLDYLDADGLSGARIGFLSRYMRGISREVRNMTIDATERMQELGAEVITLRFSLPSNGSTFYPDLEYGIDSYLESLGTGARFKSLQEIINSGEFLPELNDFAFKYLNGNIPPEEDPAYASVVAVRETLEQNLLNYMENENLDAIVYPPLMTDPPHIGTTGTLWETDNEYRYMNISPFLGFPSITIPTGIKESGIPQGITFLGRPFDEPTLIRLAYSYEQATQHRRPPSSTPPLPGEAIPEPTAIALAALGLVCAVVMLNFRIAGGNIR